MGPLDKIILTLLCSLIVIPCRAGGKNDVPDDPLVLEALIASHKNMANAEKKAVEELSMIAGEHEMTRSLASKYNNTRSLLNEKMADVYSCLALASRIADIGIQIKDVKELYEDYLTKTADHTTPFLVGLFAATNKQLGRELQHLVVQTAAAVSQQNNLLKATIAEKHQFLNTIVSRIYNIKSIIREAQRIAWMYEYIPVAVFDKITFGRSGVYEKSIKKIKTRWTTEVS